MAGLPLWLQRPQVTHVEVLPARPGETCEWPDWIPSALVTALEASGVKRPWRHQAETAELAESGQDVVVATGTGSGKSLAYQLPVLSRLLTEPKARAIYLAPTKALANDQLRAVSALELPGLRPAICDGDTPREQREWIRQHGNLILTNPDLLHHSLLPGHTRWAPVLRNLHYVVVDEGHSYRGVFGAHIAQVMRRLRRLATERLTFILATATSGDPAGSAERLIGRAVREVVADSAPRGAMTVALWEPPLLPVYPGLAAPDPTAADPIAHDTAAPNPAARGTTRADSAPTDPATADAAPVRRSALSETADLLTDAVVHGVRTLAFVPSRRGAEIVAASARRSLEEAVSGLGSQVAAYRAGYLSEERRELERAFQSGRLTGIAATNALELGIDVAGLDAVLLAGYPGTRAAMWQRAGRAGRAGRDGLCVLVARDDPLDTYLVHHPDALFRTPVEATVLDPTNPYVLAPHLCAAAAEKPLTRADLELFGAPEQLLDDLVETGALRRRPTGWYWTHPHRPQIELRGTGGSISVIEANTGRLIGTADGGSAHHHLHPGAVYTHQGRTFVVQELDLEDAVALVEADNPPFSTHAKDDVDLEVLEIRSTVDAGPIQLHLGDVEVTNQVVAFQRRRLDSGEVLGTWPLDLPPRVLRTVAVWLTFADDSLPETVADLPGSLHAAEHAAIGLLPLVASCDRWDIGGLSTALHADTEAPTIFVYDGHPGGAGFAERAYGMAREWLTATRDAVSACACDHGCPSCVQSPKCGNGNNPLDKAGAVAVLTTVLTHLPAAPTDDSGGSPDGPDTSHSGPAGQARAGTSRWSHDGLADRAGAGGGDGGAVADGDGGVQPVEAAGDEPRGVERGEPAGGSAGGGAAGGGVLGGGQG